MPYEKPEHIERIRIPDEDVNNWVETLVAAGMTQDQIDAMMTYLNDEYMNKRFDTFISEVVEDTIAEIERRSNKEMNEEQQEAIRADMVKRMQTLSFDELKLAAEEYKRRGEAK